MTSDLTPNEAAALAELEWELSAPHTLEEIAQHLGCSLRHVSRIERRALEKLRANASDEFRGSTREPAALGRRVGEFPSNGMTRKRDDE